MLSAEQAAMLRPTAADAKRRARVRTPYGDGVLLYVSRGNATSVSTAKVQMCRADGTPVRHVKFPLDAVLLLDFAPTESA